MEWLAERLADKGVGLSAASSASIAFRALRVTAASRATVVSRASGASKASGAGNARTLTAHGMRSPGRAGGGAGHVARGSVSCCGERRERRGRGMGC
ncbi:MAG: hypothetical protein LBR80_05345 [Deltaproteobacteria bacterium]|nr:hypothetical protein [Deltaproteobacteria bacterium]